eukprot:748529-Hanusia_phi.AAC.2
MIESEPGGPAGPRSRRRSSDPRLGPESDPGLPSARRPPTPGPLLPYTALSGRAQVAAASTGPGTTERIWHHGPGRAGPPGRGSEGPPGTPGTVTEHCTTQVEHTGK